MNDILAGKHDGDTGKIIELLENAINEAEKAGLMDEYYGLMDRASNRLTELLTEEASHVV